MVRDGDEAPPGAVRLPAPRLRARPPRVVSRGTRHHALVPGHVRRAQPRRLGAHPGVPARHARRSARARGPVPRRLLAAAGRPRGPLSVRGRDGDHRALLPVRGHRAPRPPSALSGRPAASLWVHPVDHHPNETAHRLAAESLVEPVRRLWKEVPVVEEEGPRSGFSGGASARPGGSGGPAARPGPSPRP